MSLSRLRQFVPSWTHVALLAVVLGLLAIAPYVAHQWTPGYQGLTVARDKDYGNYFSRIERALVGHPEEASNGITPIGSGIRGMQMAGLEQIVGMFFTWTHIPAPPLAVALSALASVASCLLLFWLFRTMAFTLRDSFLMLLVYEGVLFANVLSRVMHPGWSILVACGALIASIQFLERPSIILAVIAGQILGMLPYIYFWYWTYVWAIVGVLVLLELAHHGRHSVLLQHKKTTTLLIGIVAVVSLPFLIRTALLFNNPLFREVSIRGDVVYTHLPESWPRSILITLQGILLLSAWKWWHGDRTYRIATAMVLGIVIAMHQNVIHGRVLMFSSHFYPQLLLSTLVAGSWGVARCIGRLRMIAISGIAAVFLLAGAWDYLVIYKAWDFLIPGPFDMREQNLMVPVALLDNGKRDVVLTDYVTGRVITSWTDDGILYTTHTRFLFITDDAMAERYCLSELFWPGDVPAHRSLYMEYNDGLNTEAMRAKETKLVADACARVRNNPMQYLDQYGVTHVLWNRRERPDWVVDPDDLGLVEIGRGEEWVLWRF